MTESALICASHSPLRHCFAAPPANWEAIEAAMSTLADYVQDFDPDLVVIFGSDHFNGFFLRLMPAFCIGLAAGATDDIGGYGGKLKVPSALAAEIVDHLRGADIDPAVSYRMTVDHAFSQTLADVTGGLSAYPTVPVFINCITQPYVPFRRTRLMGEALGDFMLQTGKRVLFLASGGMSHHPTRYYPDPEDAEPVVANWQLLGGDSASDSNVGMSAEDWLARLDSMHREGAEMIVRGERTAEHMRLNAESDRQFLDVLLSGALRDFDAWDPQELIGRGGIGSMELHTWIAATAAHLRCGGAVPGLDLYTVAPELGIACGIVRG